jgi:hypothetical protein
MKCKTFVAVVLLFGMGSSYSTALFAAVAVQTNTLGAVKVVPNPWRSDRHVGESIRFQNLPAGATVKIFTVSGHLVNTLSSSTNTVTWDRTNSSGDYVASGVYLYLVTAGSEKLNGKLVIIK